MRLLSSSLSPFLVVLGLLSAASAQFAAADNEREAVQKVFQRLFGDAVRFDPELHARVLAEEPGKRHYVDHDGDGRPEEVWFVDTALRHPEAWRPILVKVVDEDGDLEMGHEPDFDSDLYVADWKGDGIVDAVCDYTDRDGDNDVDEMAFYFPGSQGGAAKDHIMVWWGDDVGDDNLLWYDIGYTYRQGACQYRSHFGGDELFCAYGIGLDDPEWACFFENPFLFYDHDDDGVTEEVIRFSGRNEEVSNLRYSFDADNDATPDSPRDFDVSISAHAPDGLTLDLRLAERRVLRGIRTGPFLLYSAAPQYCRETTWANLVLTWDENDLNIDGDNLRNGRFADPQERWEGLITKGSKVFRQIGGPSSGPLNKRFEVAHDGKHGMDLVYLPADQRLHLAHADLRWLAVDYDYDQKPDMRYEYDDTDGDGIIDQWRLDVDADGEDDDTWTGTLEGVLGVRYTWGEVNAVMASVFDVVPEQLFALNVRLQEALESLGFDTADPVAEVIASGFACEMLSDDLRARLAGSRETLRYYYDLLKDRRIVALKAEHASPEFWQCFAALRSQGNLDGLRELVEESFELTVPLPDFATAWDTIRAKCARPRVAWAQDWAPPNIGWESEVCAFRAYWGLFDFFGKTRKTLILPTIHEATNYHAELDWGMDVLHVGNSPGIGGVTLYVNGQPYPVRSPEGKGDIAWSKRLVSESEEQVTIELLGENAGPKAAPYTVRFQCTALAGRRDSRIEVLIDGGAPEDVIELGIGLTRLPQEAFAFDGDHGILANWGVQEPAIGAIGMGVVFPPKALLRVTDLPGEHQVVLEAERGRPIRYHIQGDWLRGRRFNRSPGLSNWMDDLRKTALAAHLQ